MNEFQVCGCEELKKEMAWNAIGYMLSFSLLCKNEDALKAAAIKPNCAAYTGLICSEKKEEPAMYDFITVSCRGFTGTLEHLERVGQEKVGPCSIVAIYDISIKEIENQVTHVLENVKPNEIKLVSGRVTMGG